MTLSSETNYIVPYSLGVECGRKNPFDEFANVRHVRAEHFQSLKHHLEVLLRHNIVMKSRLNKCSKVESKPNEDSTSVHGNNGHISEENDCSGVFIDGINDVVKESIATGNNEKANHTLHSSRESRRDSQDDILEAVEVRTLQDNSINLRE